MRHLVGFLIPLAMMASSAVVSAQGTDKGWAEELYPELAPREASQPPPSEPAQSSEPAAGEPALELKLDDSGVEVAPSHPPELDEMELRVKRARIGLISTAALSAVGAVFMGSFFAAGCFDLSFGGFKAVPATQFSQKAASISQGGCGALAGIGMVAVTGGPVGMIVAGSMLGVRKRKLRELRRARLEDARRARWDLARSRLVF